jgi:hypothetical protein
MRKAAVSLAEIEHFWRVWQERVPTQRETFTAIRKYYPVGWSVSHVFADIVEREFDYLRKRRQQQQPGSVPTSVIVQCAEIRNRWIIYVANDPRRKIKAARKAYKGHVQQEHAAPNQR